MRRRLGLEEAGWVDPVAATALFGLTVAEILPGGGSSSVLASALLAGAIGTLPLAWRRRLPLPVHVTVVTGNALAVLLVGHVNLLGLLLAWVLSAYTVAAHSQGWRAYAGLALQVLPVVAFANVQPAGSDELSPTQLLLMLLPWLAGRMVREYRSKAASLEEENRRLERETMARMELAAAEERERIARDVHDLVAHSVSVMVVQAEAGDAMLPSNPAGARQSFKSIQSVGREALGELRQALELLRSPADGPDGFRPGLSDVPGLVDQMAALGLKVDLYVDGEARPLPHGVEAEAYRVVREALTNTFKHAGPVAVEIRISYEPETLRLRVSDAGGQGGLFPQGTGQGLVGLRERVMRGGGQLHVGTDETGGFVVEAILVTTESRS